MKEHGLIRYRFKILLGITLVAGFVQGMLMPVIAILFEQDGISASLNGFHATGVYIGVLFATPFMEHLLNKWGYKVILLNGGILIAISLLLFPVWTSFYFWFVLRLLVGIGICMLQFGAQTWITSFSSPNQLGKNISLFGLAFGLGFGLGPMMAPLLELHESMPFLLSAGIVLLSYLSLFLLKNEYPEGVTNSRTFFSTFRNFGQAWKYAWVAFLFPFVYGFLEASLNGTFPVYALKIGIDVKAVSLILPAFAIGSIIFQLPLGMMSDQLGRRKVLITTMILGVVFFTIAGILQESVIGLVICFFIAGMFVGSTYSLGVSYMVDLIPRKLLPAGNILCSILYSIGSIGGPLIEGVSIQYIDGINFFYSISLILIGVLIALFFFKNAKANQNEIRTKTIS